MKRTDELRKLTIEELNSELLSLRKEQLQLRLKKASGSLDKTHLITMVRKTIAKIKTLLTEKAGK